MCILRKAGLSGVLMCNLFSEQSYWAKMGNQSYLRYDDAGKLTSFGMPGSAGFYSFY